MTTKEIGLKVVRQSGRFRIIKDVWRGSGYRAGLRTDWIVETEGERGAMAFDTLREAREWFDELVKEDAAALPKPASISDDQYLAAIGPCGK